MTAAQQTRPRIETRLLVLSHADTEEKILHSRFSDLPKLLKSGDLLVVNNAATLPASFSGIHERTGKPVEMRLAASRSKDLENPKQWMALFFGEGTWRTPTERRISPPILLEGDRVQFDGGLVARVQQTPSSRFTEIEFLEDHDRLWTLLYAAGLPIQYSHLKESLHLWDIQTVFAGPPVALEAPSAAFPLNWETISDLGKHGIQVVHLTHAAGISSTGDAETDRMLPLPEQFWIPEETNQAVILAKSEGRRIIAVGTSVTRALESAALQPGSGTTSLIITPEYQRKVVTGIISGFHESGASHLKLLGSFLAPEQLASAYLEAEAKGYLCHEFGDSCLIL